MITCNYNVIHFNNYSKQNSLASSVHFLPLCSTGKMLMTSQDPESAVIWVSSPLTSQLISFSILFFKHHSNIVQCICRNNMRLCFVLYFILQNELNLMSCSAVSSSQFVIVVVCKQCYEFVLFGRASLTRLQMKRFSTFTLQSWLLLVVYLKQMYYANFQLYSLIFGLGKA